MSTLADLYVMFDNIDITVIDFVYEESGSDLQATSDALQSQLQSMSTTAANQSKQLKSNEFQYTEFKTQHIESSKNNETYWDHEKLTEVSKKWNCPNCTFENKHWRKNCEICEAINDVKIRQHGQKTEAMMDDILKKYKKALSSGSNNVDLELKIDYDIGPWDCPNTSCNRRYCVRLFKIDELDVKMERDQHKKQVIVVRTQKRKRVLFKVKTSETTQTQVIEHKRVDTAELGIKNIPIAIACTKCEYILKLDHCQELIQLLSDRVLQHTI